MALSFFFIFFRGIRLPHPESAARIPWPCPSSSSSSGESDCPTRRAQRAFHGLVLLLHLLQGNQIAPPGERSAHSMALSFFFIFFRGIRLPHPESAAPIPWPCPSSSSSSGE